MRVHCWLVFNLSSSWSFSAGLINCFPVCTEPGVILPWVQILAFLAVELCEVPAGGGLKFVEVRLDWSSAIHLPATCSYLLLSTNLVRVHLSYHAESIWRYWTISIRCLTLGYLDCYSKTIILQSDCTHWLLPFDMGGLLQHPLTQDLFHCIISMVSSLSWN